MAKRPERRQRRAGLIAFGRSSSTPFPSRAEELIQSNKASLTTNQFKKLSELFLKEKGFAVEAGKINNIIPGISSRAALTSVFLVEKERPVAPYRPTARRRRRVPRALLNFKDLPACPDTPQAEEATAAPPTITGADVVNNKMTCNRPTATPKKT
ncbi:hypothetical protein EVAR_61015_1 [Eumeta japonica]|uniref:Uncharacterized protein n=1 Tax=Eumeta variegata TaxID=151549 RepID=A0A4C1ZBR6_EUMVA|nr:hypothetical protein EVAR_61015_1 [Eumeta japonica]